MKAIGWLLIMIGVGAGIDAFHGNSPYKTLVSYLQGTGAVPAGSPVPSVPVSDAGTTGITINTLPKQYQQFPTGQGPGLNGLAIGNGGN